MVCVGAISLGCAKNRVDTEVMLGLLGAAGYTVTSDPAAADVLLINTCAFITPAQRESITTILEAVRYKEEGQLKALVVAGCLAQRHGLTLLQEMPEIDALVGTGSVGDVVAAVTGALAGDKPVLLGPPGFLSGMAPRLLTTPPYLAYIKIAEGCSNRCSFCIIPALRGPYRSRPREDILTEARALAARGVKELVLVAQDTTKWGLDLYGRPELASLLREIAHLDGIRWVRLLYAYPTGISDELLQVVAAEEKICKYLDIPLQHVSPRLLRAMNRPVINAAELVTRVREAIPGVTLRTTFIVGFPGETEEDFSLLVAAVRALRFDRVGIFPYYREEGAKAAELPGQVPWKVKKERLRQLRAVAREVSFQRNQGKVGQELFVLVEGRKGRRFYGRSEGDAPEVDGKVFFTAQGNPAPGEFLRVQITRAKTYDLVGVATGVPEVP